MTDFARRMLTCGPKVQSVVLWILLCSSLSAQVQVTIPRVTGVTDQASESLAPFVGPFPDNPWYWQVDGKPVVLLGANETDHSFLMDQPVDYLDELQGLGGNLVRNTMSQREPKPFDRPHLFRSDGRYDLTRWNDSYWDRLRQFLAECHERKIIVAVEVWDKFDYQSDYWAASAWRPRNNVNYTLKQSQLRDDYHPTMRSSEKNELHHDNPFLLTLPKLQNNPVVLKHQRAFVDKVLSVTLDYPNVIYFVGNEWKESKEWPIYWANHIHRRATESGNSVPLSVMVWSSSKAFASEIEFVLGRNDLFLFAGFRVGNPKIPLGQGHYDRIMEVRDQVGRAGPRPLVDIKIRTGSKMFYHPVRQARVWRGLMAGWSALSHHRVHEHPERGTSEDMGFTSAAIANLSALRKFCDQVRPWECVPSPDLLSERSEDEAYVLANPGKAYGVYFVTEGSVGLRLSEGRYNMQWINIETGESHGAEESVTGGGIIQVETPGSGSRFGWAVTFSHAD